MNEKKETELRLGMRVGLGIAKAIGYSAAVTFAVVLTAWNLVEGQVEVVNHTKDELKKHVIPIFNGISALSVEQLVEIKKRQSTER